jgi:hypothetical protein
MIFKIIAGFAKFERVYEDEQQEVIGFAAPATR